MVTVSGAEMFPTEAVADVEDMVTVTACAWLAPLLLLLPPPHAAITTVADSITEAFHCIVIRIRGHPIERKVIATPQCCLRFRLAVFPKSPAFPSRVTREQTDGLQLDTICKSSAGCSCHRS